MRWHNSQQSRQAKENAAALVVQWLKRCCLANYAQAFLDNGYDELSICCAIQDVDLDAIGIQEASHRQILKEAVTALKAGETAPNLYFDYEVTAATAATAAVEEKEEAKGGKEEEEEDGEATAAMNRVPVSASASASAIAPAPAPVSTAAAAAGATGTVATAAAVLGTVTAGEQACRGLTEAQKRAMAQIRFPKLHLFAMVRERLLRDRLDLAAPPYVTKNGELADLDGLAEQICQELGAQKRDVIEALAYFRQRKMNFDKCLHQNSGSASPETRERCASGDNYFDRCSNPSQSPSASMKSEEDDYYSVIPASACTPVSKLLARCTTAQVAKRRKSRGGMSQPKRSPFTKLFRRRFLKRSNEKESDLIAANITMGDEDRVALMRQVRAGLITTEDAWQRVREYERIRRQQQQQQQPGMAAESQTDEDIMRHQPRFSPQLNLRKLAHLRLNTGPMFDPNAVTRLFEEAGSSAPNSPSNCERNRRRTTPRDFESPYQSDVSLSAPSSPTMESYYEIPYHNHPQMPFPLPPHPNAFHDQRHAYSPPRSGYFFGAPPPPFGAFTNSLSPPSTTTGEDTSSHSTRDSGPGGRKRRPSTLGELLDRLGIAHLHQPLAAHGVATLQDFSRLTCATLSAIGVQDIEQRAKILTAVELMSDDEVEDEGNFYTMPVETNGGGGGPGHCPPGPQRDSGCYGSSDTVGHGSGPMCRDASEQTTGLCRLPLTEENERTEDDEDEDEDEEDEDESVDDVGTQTMGPGSMSMGASPSVKKTRIKLPTSALRMPRSNVHGDIECRLEINPDGYVANVFCNRGVKGPVAVRAAAGNNVGSPRSSLRQPQPQQQQQPQQQPQPPPHFAAQGPKLAGLSLRNHADQISPFVPVTGVRPTAAHSVTSSSSSNSSQHRPVGGGPRASSSFRQEKHAKHFSPKKPVQTTEKLVEEKLRVEHIRLSDHPYSNEAGQFGIPLRLIQRYCAELERDLRQVALAMEHIRDTQLREQRRPVVSHIEEILTDRYLNCDCIKTDSIADFLVTLGLPMYIPSVLARMQRDKITPSVDNLLRLSEPDLVEQIGFTTIHSRWLKEAFVPSMLGKSKMAYLDKV